MVRVRAENYIIVSYTFFIELNTYIIFKRQIGLWMKNNRIIWEYIFDDADFQRNTNYTLPISLTINTALIIVEDA